MSHRPANLRHRWELTPQEARAVQQELRGQVRVEPVRLEQVQTVAGIDASFGGGQVYAGASRGCSSSGKRRPRSRRWRDLNPCRTY